jgi:hypothetical protein
MRGSITFDAEREPPTSRLWNVKGSATTDFGALDAVPESDSLPGWG